MRHENKKVSECDVGSHFQILTCFQIFSIINNCDCLQILQLVNCKIIYSAINRPRLSFIHIYLCATLQKATCVSEQASLKGSSDSPFRHELVVLTGEASLVEHLPSFTRDESGIAIDAGDEAPAVSRDGKAREWKELGRDGMSRHLLGTLESNDGCNYSETQVRYCPYRPSAASS